MCADIVTNMLNGELNIYKFRSLSQNGLPRGLTASRICFNARDTGDTGSIPGWGRSPGGGHGNPLQYSCLENPMDRGTWGWGGYSSWGRRESDTTEATEQSREHLTELYVTDVSINFSHPFSESNSGLTLMANNCL